MPAASPPTLEKRLEARPHRPTAMARAEAGERIDRLLNDIAELQRLIDRAPPETLEDAAVKLGVRLRAR